MKGLVFLFAVVVVSIPLPGQQLLAFWDFNQCAKDFASRGHVSCTSGGTMTGATLITKESGATNCVLVLTAGSRTQIEFSVDPRGNTVSLGAIRFDVMRVSCSWITRIAVSADEDPGPGGDNFKTHIAGTSLPRETSVKVMKTRPVFFSLGSAKHLQNVRTPIRVRVVFTGSLPSGCSSTKLWSSCLDNVRITGTCVCAQATATDLGSANCTPKLTMSVDRPPALGTTVTFTLQAASTGDPVYLWIGTGCGTGKTVLWPTTCKLWLDPAGFWVPAGRAVLDATGRVRFTLPVPASYAPLTGLQFSAQALLWTKAGDSLSNGYCLRLGCR